MFQNDQTTMHKSRHRLVSDGLAAGEAEVQIRVTDMNDNVPYFKDRIYTARVPENTDAGTVVITVTAEDKDEGKFMAVLFIAKYVLAD